MIAVNTKQKMKSVAYWYSNSFSEGLKQTPCNHAGQRRGKKKQHTAAYILMMSI